MKMTTEEKLQLIDHLRSGFARSIQQIVEDEPGIVGSIAVDINFYAVADNAPLWEAARILGWDHRESQGTVWFVSNDNQGETILFL